MPEKYWYLISGIVIGWIFKVPFLIKWYRDLKKTRGYEEMKRQEHIKKLEERFKKRWPEADILNH